MTLVKFGHLRDRGEITWISGQTGSGKTTLAHKLSRAADRPTIVLDGDTLRELWSREFPGGAVSDVRISAFPKLGLDPTSRVQQNYRAAALAEFLAERGFDVIVAVICPYQWQRAAIELNVEGIRWIHLPGGHPTDAEHPYDDWQNIVGMNAPPPADFSI